MNCEKNTCYWLSPLSPELSRFAFLSKSFVSFKLLVEREHLDCLIESSRTSPAPPTSSTSRHAASHTNSSQLPDTSSLTPPLSLSWTAWLKCPLVCAAAQSSPGTLLTLHSVLDGGTGFLKAGYAGQVSFQHAAQCVCQTVANKPLQNFPDHQYPSIVGRPILRTEERDGGDIQLKDIMCGDEAAAARSMLQITYPVRGCSTTVEGTLSAR